MALASGEAGWGWGGGSEGVRRALPGARVVLDADAAAGCYLLR